jgi:hypothetical protein
VPKHSLQLPIFAQLVQLDLCMGQLSVSLPRLLSIVDKQEEAEAHTCYKEHAHEDKEAAPLFTLEAVCVLISRLLHFWCHLPLSFKHSFLYLFLVIGNFCLWLL